jgi:hypothetical protein
MMGVSESWEELNLKSYLKYLIKYKNVSSIILFVAGDFISTS